MNLCPLLSILLISALIFVISFLLPALGLIWSFSILSRDLRKFLKRLGLRLLCCAEISIQHYKFSSQFSSVAQLCATLCDPMACSTPGFPVHHQLPEFVQTHVQQVRDPIQPSCPLSSPLLLPSIFPSIRVFSNESVLCIRWPKYWSFSFSISPSNGHSRLISFRTDWFDLLSF